MRILIDARPATETGSTGVGHYTRRILEHLPASMPDAEIVAWHEGRGRRDLPPAPNVTEYVSRAPVALERLWRRLDVPTLDRQVRFDAFLATNFVPPPTRSSGVVLVVHDLAFEVMPETGPRFGERWRRRFDAWLRRSAAVIVPSASARDDVLRRHGIPDARIRVIPHGADPFEPPSPSDVERTRTKFGLDAPYALFVGGIEPRKNLGALVKAFGMLEHADARLVISGGPVRWAPDAATELRAQVDALPDRVHRRVLLTGYLSEAEKRALLSGATALAYPSRYEGFGFPVLEAFAAGVPVLTSTAASLPEVAGDAALLVDPDDVDAIARNLGWLFEDAAVRARLVAAGRERVAAFRWEDSAAATAEVLRRSAGRNATAG